MIPDPMKLMSFLGSGRPLELDEEPFLLLAAMMVNVLREEGVQDPLATMSAQELVEHATALVNAGYVPRWSPSHDFRGLVIGDIEGDL